MKRRRDNKLAILILAGWFFLPTHWWWDWPSPREVIKEDLPVDMLRFDDGREWLR